MRGKLSGFTHGILKLSLHAAALSKSHKPDKIKKDGGILVFLMSLHFSQSEFLMYNFFNSSVLFGSFPPSRKSLTAFCPKQWTINFYNVVYNMVCSVIPNYFYISNCLIYRRGFFSQTIRNSKNIS